MGAAERWYRNLAFRKKVWISFLAVSLIPVIILGAFSYFQTRKLLVQREQEVLSETLKQSVLTLNANLESCEHIMENIVWDSLIKQALEKQYTSNYEMYLSYRDVIDPAFLRIKSLNPQVKSITIYSSNSTLYSHGDHLMPIQMLERLPEGIEDCRIHWVVSPGADLELYCGIYTRRGAPRNVVRICVDTEKIFGYLTELFAENYGVLITDEEGSTIFGCQIWEGEHVGRELKSQEILDGSRSLRH